MKAGEERPSADMRALGIDFGEKRIGVALSDPARLLAFPHDTIEYNGKTRTAVRMVAHAVRKSEATLVVVGLPLNMDGTRGKQADRVSTFVGELRLEVGEAISVEMWDERLSSVQAGRVLEEAGLDARQRRGKVDRIAAALILQAYLDFTHNSEGEHTR